MNEGFEGKESSSVLMIRLSRRGAPKKPVYRIVVIEKDRARDGRSVEVVGLYDPRTNPQTVDFKRDRVEYWVGKGAKMSPTVSRLFAKAPAPTAVA
ncbi:MAG TPA: 30S ribosomal protein S16 [candidate division Zixibacteria bacterium]|nr:30S ribosomal protein S16 [candidate division Zixibacteria bacterium]